MKKITLNKQGKLNIVFIAIFMLILILPWVFLNRKEDQVSEIENKKLADWPGLSLTLETDAEIEEYVNDRIGFKETAVGIYTEVNDKLFNVMVHPLFMWGEENHIYYKDKDYIAAYQRLNTDPEYIDSMVSFLGKTNDYLKSKGIDFLYYVCPDKKTIYPEYFPKTVNVDMANESVLEYLDEAMGKTDITYINPKEKLLEAKKDLVVYNKQYDATHWNEFGAFIGHSLIDDHIRNTFEEVKPLDVNDYDIEMVTMTSLDNAKFTISDDVPLYSLKDDRSGDYTELLKPWMECETDTFYTHHINPEVENNRILLVFTDSYFQAAQKFYDNRFKEVYFVHRQNYEYVQYFVNMVFPDMVIFETAERSISSEMPLTADFTDYCYEPPFNAYEPVDNRKNPFGEGTIDENNRLEYVVTGGYGAKVEGSSIVMSPDDTTQIVRIEFTVLSDDPDINIYAATADETMECDYFKQDEDYIETGVRTYSLNVQRRYMAEGTIRLFAENSTTHETYLLDDLNIVYR